MVRIAKRYAKALFGLTAGDLGTAKKERDSLVGLKGLFTQKDAGRVLRNPVMPVDLKRSLLEYGLTQVEASDGVKKLVQTVLEAGRVELLPEVADAYGELIDAAEGRVHAEVISAGGLSADELARIDQTLAQLLKKKVELTPHVDPSLLGGFVVRVGNYRIDLSLKSKLNGLANAAVQESTLPI